MISLLVNFAAFFLVLFFLLPSLMIFLMIVRELIHQRRKQVGVQRWNRAEGGELTG